MELSSFKINKWEVGPAKMTADILHAGFNIFFNSLFKKKDAAGLGKTKKQVKKNPDSIYKNVPQ